jgi:hypothetical protein
MQAHLPSGMHMAAAATAHGALRARPASQQSTPAVAVSGAAHWQQGVHMATAHPDQSVGLAGHAAACWQPASLPASPQASFARSRRAPERPWQVQQTLPHSTPPSVIAAERGGGAPAGQRAATPMALARAAMGARSAIWRTEPAADPANRGMATEGHASTLWQGGKAQPAGLSWHEGSDARAGAGSGMGQSGDVNVRPCAETQHIHGAAGGPAGQGQQARAAKGHAGDHGADTDRRRLRLVKTNTARLVARRRRACASLVSFPIL